MATLTSSLNTEFTPAASDFIAQSTGGDVALLRKNTSGAVFTQVGILSAGVSYICANPVAGAVYKALSANGNPTFQADQ